VFYNTQTGGQARHFEKPTKYFFKSQTLRLHVQNWGRKYSWRDGRCVARYCSHVYMEGSLLGCVPVTCTSKMAAYHATY